MITLRKVDARNIWQIVALEVREEQKSFVATNTESILEAYCAVTNGGVALPFGIYDGDTPVGFFDDRLRLRRLGGCPRHCPEQLFHLAADD